MKIFGKREKKNGCCGGGDTLSQGSIHSKEGLFILGTGCSKCRELEKNVLTAISQMNTALPIGHITDLAEIASYGIMSTPALVLNGKVISYGRVLSAEEVKKLLQIYI